MNKKVRGGHLIWGLWTPKSYFLAAHWHKWRNSPILYSSKSTFSIYCQNPNSIIGFIKIYLEDPNCYLSLQYSSKLHLQSTLALKFACTPWELEIVLRSTFLRLSAKVFARCALWWKAFLSFGVAGLLFSTSCPGLFGSRSAVGSSSSSFSLSLYFFFPLDFVKHFLWFSVLCCGLILLIGPFTVRLSLCCFSFVFGLFLFLLAVSFLFFSLFSPFGRLVPCLFCMFSSINEKSSMTLLLKKIISTDDNGWVIFSAHKIFCS